MVGIFKYTQHIIANKYGEIFKTQVRHLQSEVKA